MKYIKTYEENKYKKYAIWKKTDSSSILSIIKILPSSNETKIRIKVLLVYNKRKKILEPPVPGEFNEFYNEYANKRIIFTSNDLEECKKQIEIFEVSNKYNL